MPNTASLRKDITMFDPVSAVEAVGALIRPRVLFCSDAAERLALVETCVKAWNIGCMVTAAEREAAIAAQKERDIAAGVRAAGGRTDVLRILVEQRHEAFPYLRSTIDHARLSLGSESDDLAIDSRGGHEFLRIAWQPTAAHLSLALSAVVQVGALLTQMPVDVRGWVSRSAAAPDVWATRASNQCRLLLLNLSTCRSMIVVLRSQSLDDRQFEAEMEDLCRVERGVLAFLDGLSRA